MWDTVGTITGVLVIILLFEVLDITEALKDRLRGRPSREDLVKRLDALERQVRELQKRPS